MSVTNVWADQGVSHRFCLVAQELGLQIRVFSGFGDLRRALSSDDDGIIVLDGETPYAGLSYLLNDLAVREIDLPVVAIVQDITVPEAVKLMKMGVAEILERDASAPELKRVILNALATESVRQSSRTSRRDALRRLNALSLEETALLEMLIGDLSLSHAALALGQPLQIVERERTQILEKLDIETVADAPAVVAAALGVSTAMLGTISSWLHRTASDQE